MSWTPLFCLNACAPQKGLPVRKRDLAFYSCTRRVRGVGTGNEKGKPAGSNCGAEELADQPHPKRSYAVNRRTTRPSFRNLRQWKADGPRASRGYVKLAPPERVWRLAPNQLDASLDEQRRNVKRRFAAGPKPEQQPQRCSSKVFRAPARP
jgi:hypothetical protein